MYKHYIILILFLVIHAITIALNVSAQFDHFSIMRLIHLTLNTGLAIVIACGIADLEILNEELDELSKRL